MSPHTVLIPLAYCIGTECLITAITCVPVWYNTRPNASTRRGESKNAYNTYQQKSIRREVKAASPINASYHRPRPPRARSDPVVVYRGYYFCSLHQDQHDGCLIVCVGSSLLRCVSHNHERGAVLTHCLAAAAWLAEDGWSQQQEEEGGCVGNQWVCVRVPSVLISRGVLCQ